MKIYKCLGRHFNLKSEKDPQVADLYCRAIDAKVGQLCFRLRLNGIYSRCLDNLDVAGTFDFVIRGVNKSCWYGPNLITVPNCPRQNHTEANGEDIISLVQTMV